jgi:hypothetical protein
VHARVSFFVYDSSYRYYQHAFLPVEFNQWTWFDVAAIVFFFLYLPLSLSSSCWCQLIVDMIVDMNGHINMIIYVYSSTSIYLFIWETIKILYFL